MRFKLIVLLTPLLLLPACEKEPGGVKTASDCPVKNLDPPEDMLAEWEGYPAGTPRGNFVVDYDLREETIERLCH
jgi:hypothetical protein